MSRSNSRQEKNVGIKRVQMMDTHTHTQKKDSLMDKNEKSNEANNSSHKNNNPEEQSMRSTATVNRHSFGFASSHFIARGQTRCKGKGMERRNEIVCIRIGIIYQDRPKTSSKAETKITIVRHYDILHYGFPVFMSY